MIRNEVRTKRLILRPLKVSDYSIWYDCWANSLPSQSEWDPGPKPARKCTKAQFLKLIRRHNKLAKNDDYYWFATGTARRRAEAAEAALG